MPIRLAAIFGRSQPGFLLEFARDATCDIDRTATDVVEVGRTGWEIDAPRVRGVLSHFAKRKRVVAGKQRPHTKAVEHVLVGKTPVAPRQEHGEIGLEIALRYAAA